LERLSWKVMQSLAEVTSRAADVDERVMRILENKRDWDSLQR